MLIKTGFFIYIISQWKVVRQIPVNYLHKIKNWELLKDGDLGRYLAETLLWLMLPTWLSGEASAWQCRRQSFNTGSGRSPEEENGYWLQYSCLENPMDRGAWRVIVHGVTKSQTWLSEQVHMLYLYWVISFSLLHRWRNWDSAWLHFEEETALQFQFISTSHAHFSMIFFFLSFPWRCLPLGGFCNPDLCIGREQVGPMIPWFVSPPTIFISGSNTMVGLPEKLKISLGWDWME